MATSRVNGARPRTTCSAAGAGGDAGSSTRAIPSTASTIARYPVQRQRLPFIARGRSARFASSSAATVMIIPGVQKPHWNPCAAAKARGTESSASPSIVVTRCPAARAAG